MPENSYFVSQDIIADFSDTRSHTPIPKTMPSSVIADHLKAPD